MQLALAYGVPRADATVLLATAPAGCAFDRCLPGCADMLALLPSVPALSYPLPLHEVLPKFSVSAVSPDSLQMQRVDLAAAQVVEHYPSLRASLRAPIGGAFLWPLVHSCLSHASAMLDHFCSTSREQLLPAARPPSPPPSPPSAHSQIMLAAYAGPSLCEDRAPLPSTVCATEWIAAASAVTQTFEDAAPGAVPAGAVAFPVGDQVVIVTGSAAAGRDLDWPEPQLPLCDRCGADCTAELALRAPELASCHRCGWALDAPYFEIDAYDMGDGGSCICCGGRQAPDTQCVGCGACVLSCDTEHYYVFDGWHSREQLLAIAATLAIEPLPLECLLVDAGMYSLDARSFAVGYARYAGYVPREHPAYMCDYCLVFGRVRPWSSVLALARTWLLPPDVLELVFCAGGLSAYDSARLIRVSQVKTARY